MNPTAQFWRTGLSVLAAVLTCFGATAQSTNHTAEAIKPAEASKPSESAASTDTSSQGFGESAFRIVSERNIFNANRSGQGEVRTSRSTRPGRVDSFALVGTMAYEKGAYAFFEGSGSDLTKVLKPEGVIAGHKLVDIYANAVKLEYDGKEIEMPVGCQMRREDQGSWHMTETPSGGGTVASAERSYTNGGGGSNGDSYRGSRSDRSRNGDSRSRTRGSDSGSTRQYRSDSTESRTTSAAPSTTNSNESESEVMKRLMERREKDAQ